MQNRFFYDSHQDAMQMHGSTLGAYHPTPIRSFEMYQEQMQLPEGLQQPIYYDAPFMQTAYNHNMLAPSQGTYVSDMQSLQNSFGQRADIENAYNFHRPEESLAILAAYRQDSAFQPQRADIENAYNFHRPEESLAILAAYRQDSAFQPRRAAIENSYNFHRPEESLAILAAYRQDNALQPQPIFAPSTLSKKKKTDNRRLSTTDLSQLSLNTFNQSSSLKRTLKSRTNLNSYNGLQVVPDSVHQLEQASSQPVKKLRTLPHQASDLVEFSVFQPVNGLDLLTNCAPGVAAERVPDEPTVAVVNCNDYAWI